MSVIMELRKTCALFGRHVVSPEGYIVLRSCNDVMCETRLFSPVDSGFVVYDIGNGQQKYSTEYAHYNSDYFIKIVVHTNIYVGIDFYKDNTSYKSSSQNNHKKLLQNLDTLCETSKLILHSMQERELKN